MSILLIILISLTMTRFSEKMLISTRCIRGFMSNLIKNLGRTLSCLPSLRLAKFMCFLLLFFIEERQQNAVTFFLRTTPATIVCLFSVHQASLASLHCLLLKKMHRFQEDFRSGKNDYQVYFLLPSTKCDFFVRKYSWVVVMNPSRAGLSHTSSWRIFIPALLGLCPFSAHLEIKD